MYPALKFECKLTSPFHTSEYNYSNLYTCAPYIMGSTLRGAILRCLIDEVGCNHLDELHARNPDFHKDCPENCPLKPLFFPPTRFSFGHFDEKEANKVYIHTRVGISRESCSAAQGALVSIEVHKGDKFRFEIMYPELGLEGFIKKGVELAGSRFGIGRFRSIGWGQFEVCSCDYVKPNMPPRASKYEFEFRTPYVLNGDSEEGEIIKEKLYKRLCDATPCIEVPQIENVKTQVTSFSYVRRWSDEKGHKENRLVLDKGTKLEVSFSQDVAPEHLYIWQWGIGEWYEYGFGSFVAKVINRNGGKK
ncbi:MAG: RAMP superfamily CRISPR-associated protein [bacterium]